MSFLFSLLSSATAATTPTPSPALAQSYSSANPLLIIHEPLSQQAGYIFPLQKCEFEPKRFLPRTPLILPFQHYTLDKERIPVSLNGVLIGTEYMMRLNEKNEKVRYFAEGTGRLSHIVYESSECIIYFESVNKSNHLLLQRVEMKINEI